MNTITLENTISKVIITYIGCLENDEIMLRQLRAGSLLLFHSAYIKRSSYDYYNNIDIFLVKVVMCVSFVIDLI